MKNVLLDITYIFCVYIFIFYTNFPSLFNLRIEKEARALCVEIHENRTNYIRKEEKPNINLNRFHRLTT